MTDHPHAKLLEGMHSALSTAEWHIAARMIELRDARQPSGEAAAALNKVRDAIRELSTDQRERNRAFAKADATIALRPTPSRETDEAAFEAWRKKIDIDPINYALRAGLHDAFLAGCRSRRTVDLARNRSRRPNPLKRRAGT